MFVLHSPLHKHRSTKLKEAKKEGYNLGKYIIHFATQAGIVVNVNQVANLPSYPIEYVTQKNTYNEYTISN